MYSASLSPHSAPMPLPRCRAASPNTQPPELTSPPKISANEFRDIIINLSKGAMPGRLGCIQAVATHLPALPCFVVYPVNLHLKLA